jgi:UDP-2,3-diacylglucosamine hydrolase
MCKLCKNPAIMQPNYSIIVKGKIYFIADIHLGNRYLNNTSDAEKKLVQWLDSIKNDASAIYFLGDTFDFWYEYKHVAPRGHVRFLGKLAELSDSGTEIHFVTGNHDIWMFDYLPNEIGAIIHRKPIAVELLGKNFFLAHGDEVGYRPFLYRFIQSLFRNRLCQILFSNIHPRWSFSFAHSWSLSSRKQGLNAEKNKKAQARNIQALEKFAKSYLQSHPDIHYFVFGHLHLLLDRNLDPNLIDSPRLLITGDWMELFSYTIWDSNQLSLKQFP